MSVNMTMAKVSIEAQHLALQIDQVLPDNGLSNLLALDVVCARIDRFGKLVHTIQPNIRLSID